MRKVTIKKSGIHGDGVFALRDMKKGETIFVIKGKVVTLSVKTKKQSLSYPNWIGLSKEVWIDPESPGKNLNHSCDANAGIKGKLFVKALRKINKGDEITIDYSTVEADPLWEMSCDCGSPICRKKIRSIDYLPAKIFKRYYPFINSNFKRNYIRKHSSLRFEL